MRRWLNKNYTRTWNICLIRPTSWLPCSDLLHPSAYQIMLWMANIHRYLQSPDSKNVHLFFSTLSPRLFFAVVSGCEFLLPFHISNICKRNMAYRSQHQQHWTNKKCVSTLMAIGIGWCSGPNYPLIGIDVLNRWTRGIFSNASHCTHTPDKYCNAPSNFHWCTQQ